MIRELAKKLSAFAEVVDFVIIELQFRRGTFEAGAQIVKEHSSMILLRASSAEAELVVKMIRPRKKITAALGSRIQSAERIWRVFTASEVSDFVQAVGDNNPIHRLNPPIVPAFLILETICAEVTADFIRLKFKNFSTAGEPLSLHVDGNRLEIRGAGVRKVLASFKQLNQLLAD